MGGLVCLLSDSLLGIFLKDNAEAIVYGKSRLLVTCLPYFLCGIMEAGTGALRGINKALPALVNSIVFACIMRAIWCQTVFKMFPTIDALYISYPITWGLTAALHIIMFAFYFKKLKKNSTL